VIVVDNASTDGSPDMVSREFPGVILLRNETNAGFAAANNQALPLAQGKFVLLLNPDTEVRSGALETMMAFLRDHPQAGAVGPLLLNPDGSWQKSAFPFYGFWRSLVENRLVDLIRPLPGQPSEDSPVDWVIGAALMTRREVLEEVGPLDERFFMYGEETDWQIRLRRAGYQVYLLPSAQVVHHGGQASRQARRQAMWNDYRGRHLLLAKHYSAVSRVAFDLKTCIGLIFWIVIWQLRAWLETADKRMRAQEWSSAYRATLARYVRALSTGEWHLDTPIVLPKDRGATGELSTFANQPEQPQAPVPALQHTQPAQQGTVLSNSSLPQENADVKSI
jgi:GT2 family glycosyltransferase